MQMNFDLNAMENEIERYCKDLKTCLMNLPIAPLHHQDLLVGLVQSPSPLPLHPYVCKKHTISLYIIRHYAFLCVIRTDCRGVCKYCEGLSVGDHF